MASAVLRPNTVSLHGPMERRLVEELIRKACNRDKEAFADLVRLCTPDLYKVARAILRNDMDVADAMQETLLACWEKLGDLRDERYFKTWVTRILINKCYVVLRNQAKRPQCEIPEDMGASDESLAEVEWRLLLDELDDKHRLVIVLHYVMGYKVSEIATLIGTNENTVKSRLVVARKRYGEALQRAERP